MYLYVGQYPGSNDKEINTLGAEETNSLLEESQCEGVMRGKQNDSREQAHHMRNQN